MNDSGYCECDGAAHERGDPFCGWCGRRAASPWLHDAAGELPLNLPYRLPEKPEPGQPFLNIAIKPHSAAPGIVDSSRFFDASGKLSLTRLDFVWQDRSIELEPTISGSRFSFNLPREFESSGLPGLAAVRCTFELHNPGARRPYIHTLHLQPAGKMTLVSEDSRFEDRIAPAAGLDPYTLWLFDGAASSIDLSLIHQPHHGIIAPPDFRTIRVGLQSAVRRVIAGTVLKSNVDVTTIRLNPAALREALAPFNEGNLWLLLESKHARETAVFDIRICTRPSPKLFLEKPVVFEINFKAHKKGWLTKGCDDLKNILNFEDDVRLWKPQFALSVVASAELNEAAHFSARVDAGYLTVTARLKPEWLNVSKLPPLEGKATILLRNTNNSRQNEQAAPPATIPALVEIKVVLDWDKRGGVPVLAIDFGTTNTCAAVISSYNDMTSHEIAIDGESDSNVPTLLFYTLNADATGHEFVESVVYGKKALSEGRRLISSSCFKKGIKTELLNPKQRRIPVGELLSLSASEVTTDFIAAFLKAAMLSPEVDGRPIEKLVYTFPVAASPQYAQLLGDSIQAAVRALRLPIRHEDIIKSCDEASAGGIWWFCQKKLSSQLSDNVSVLVFDYGGGTTDLSVLEFNRLPDGKWQVTIKGISGLAPCGGEDLTWRMAREFVACAANEVPENDARLPNASGPQLQPIRPDSMLGRNLKSTAALYGRDDWQKKPYTRFLLEVLEERKIAAVGGEQIDALPKAVLLDLLENAESAFVPGTLTFRGETVSLEDSCSQGGSIGVAKFSDYKQHLSEFIAAASPGEGMLPGHAWLFKIQEKLLEEPLRAIDVAGHLIEHLYGDGKVDYLLLIGQASKTRAVQAMIRSKLAGKFGELASEGMQKPKSCVALGACDFHMQRADWDFRPTLLHRIIYLDGMTFKQILRSDTERNSIVTLTDPDALRRPGSKLTVLFDCSYSNRGEEGLRQEMEAIGPPGFDRRENGQTLSVVVASPENGKSYALLPEKIRAIVDGFKQNTESHDWYFLAWLDNDVERAWKFRYHL